MSWCPFTRKRVTRQPTAVLTVQYLHTVCSAAWMCNWRRGRERAISDGVRPTRVCFAVVLAGPPSDLTVAVDSPQVCYHMLLAAAGDSASRSFCAPHRNRNQVSGNAARHRGGIGRRKGQTRWVYAGAVAAPLAERWIQLHLGVRIGPSEFCGSSCQEEGISCVQCRLTQINECGGRRTGHHGKDL